MALKTQLKNLTEPDIYSLLMFALYKSGEEPECAALSQLSYILDLDNLLKLCEFFGGLTLKIPTINELEELVYGLLLFQLHDIEHMSYDEAVAEIQQSALDIHHVEKRYRQLRGILSTYDFNSGR